MVLDLAYVIFLILVLLCYQQIEVRFFLETKGYILEHRCNTVAILEMFDSISAALATTSKHNGFRTVSGPFLEQ